MNNRTVGFICHRNKGNNSSVLKELAQIAQRLGIRSATFPEVARNIDFPFLNIEEVNVDFIAAIGGDGSVIWASEFASKHNRPLIAINNGRVGFLTEIEIKEFESALTRIYSGDYTIDKRMMISCNVQDAEYVSLNDFTVYKKSFAGVVQLKIAIDGIDAGEVFCDGVVVSTPTGATAYSISAGGPVIAPGLNALIVTPICPHSLCFRPIVADADSVVKITVKTDGFLACAGEAVNDIAAGSVITVKRSDLVCDFLILREHNIYSLIRSKLT